MWVGENESAKYRTTVLNSLHCRGDEDIFIARTDNLTGFSMRSRQYLQRTIFKSVLYINRAIPVSIGLKSLTKNYTSRFYLECAFPSGAGSLCAKSTESIQESVIIITFLVVSHSAARSELYTAKSLNPGINYSPNNIRS